MSLKLGMDAVLSVVPEDRLGLSRALVAAFKSECDELELQLNISNMAWSIIRLGLIGFNFDLCRRELERLLLLLEELDLVVDLSVSRLVVTWDLDGVFDSEFRLDLDFDSKLGRRASLYSCLGSPSWFPALP